MLLQRLKVQLCSLSREKLSANGTGLQSQHLLGPLLLNLLQRFEKASVTLYYCSLKLN